MSTIVLAHEPFYRPPPIRLLNGPTGRILVVGDDPATAGVIARALCGCDVHGVGTPHEAMRLLASSGPFDAFFCDLPLRHRPTGAPALHAALERLGEDHSSRLVFVVEQGISVRQHWFLGTMDNPVLEKPLDVAAIVELAWGGEPPATARVRARPSPRSRPRTM